MASAEMAIDLTSDAASDDRSDQDGEPTPYSRYGKDEIVTLFVGDERTEMLAFASCLSFHSEFFKTALKKEWAEGQTRTIKLPEEEPEIVAQYLDYVLGKGLPTDSTNLDARGEVYTTLTMLFAVGERVLDSGLRNAIIAEIIRFTTILVVGPTYVFPNALQINNIYNCTTSASPARRLMVDLFMLAGNTTWLVDTLHPAFLKDMAEALMLQVQTTELPCRIWQKAAEEYSV